ncbi:MAG: hypothetical protein K2M92_03820, partial [Bacteroidales bacterium]|nr:hypothetical protein [Bacteroidales bacterium]
FVVFCVLLVLFFVVLGFWLWRFEEATFTVVMTGNTHLPARVDWYLNGNLAQSSADLTYKTSTLADGDKLYAEVQLSADELCDGLQLLYSDTVSVTVNPTPVVEAGDDQVVDLGDTVQMNGSVLSGLKDPMTYRWVPQTQPANTLSTQFIAEHAGYRYLYATNGYGCTGYDSLYIDLSECNYIEAQSPVTGNEVCEGDSVRFNITVGGTHAGNPQRIWQISTDGGNTWSNISTGSDYKAESTSLLVRSAKASMNNALYRMVFVPDATLDMSCDTLYSLPYELKVNAAGRTLSAGLQDPGVICDDEATITFTLNGNFEEGDLYEWYVNDVAVGQGSASLTLNRARIAHGDQLKAVVKASAQACADNQEVVDTLTIKINPALTLRAWADTIINRNTQAALHADAQGGTAPFTYAWKQSAYTQDAASAHTFTTTLAATRLFEVEATDQAGCKATAQVRVSVTDTCIDGIVIAGDNQTKTVFDLCRDSAITFDALVSGGMPGGYTLSWTVSPTLPAADLVTSANGASLWLKPSVAGVFTLTARVTDTTALGAALCTSAQRTHTAIVTLNVSAPTTYAVSVAEVDALCEKNVQEGEFSLQATVTGITDYTLAWYRIRNNVEIALGNGSTTLILTDAVDEDLYYAVVTPLENCVDAASRHSDTVKATIWPSPTVNPQNARYNPGRACT